MFPRESQDQPAIKVQLVVAPAITHQLSPLGVEFVTICLDHDPQFFAHQIWTQYGVIEVHLYLWNEDRADGLQCEGPQGGLKWIGCKH